MLWLSGKEFACQCRRCGFDPWVRKIPWRRKWLPLQNSCLGSPMDRGTWWAIVLGITKNWTGLRDWACTAHILQWIRFSLSPETLSFLKKNIYEGQEPCLPRGTEKYSLSTLKKKKPTHNKAERKCLPFYYSGRESDIVLFSVITLYFVPIL